MAELTNQCCTPGAQQTCCEPSEKASCCGETHGTACGCAAGATTAATVHVRSADATDNSDSRRAVWASTRDRAT